MISAALFSFSFSLPFPFPFPLADLAGVFPPRFFGLGREGVFAFPFPLLLRADAAVFAFLALLDAASFSSSSSSSTSSPPSSSLEEAPLFLFLLELAAFSALAFFFAAGVFERPSPPPPLVLLLLVLLVEAEAPPSLAPSLPSAALAEAFVAFSLAGVFPFAFPLAFAGVLALAFAGVLALDFVAFFGAGFFARVFFAEDVAAAAELPPERAELRVRRVATMVWLGDLLLGEGRAGNEGAVRPDPPTVSRLNFLVCV